MDTTPAPAATTPAPSGTGPLEGRTAVVTGSTSGIGAATARLLAADGASVVVSGRPGGRGPAVADAITAAGQRATFLPVDLAGPPSAIRAFAAEAEDTLGGRIDILVNNAGVYPTDATLDIGDDQLDEVLAINLRAPHVLVAAIAPGMIARGSGVVVNIASWMGQVGTRMAALYTATKAADEQLARSWAAELGPQGIRVNALAPGATLTEGNAVHRQALDAMTAGTPAGVVVHPDDIARGVRYLVSDDARMVHGITLNVDGGIASTRMG